MGRQGEFMKSLIVRLGLVSLALLAAACNCGKKCDAGALTCPCKSGSVCDTGLVCQADNTCGGGVAKGVHVDATARGCELLLTEAAGTTVAGVSFTNGLKGTFVRESPKVAVTFVAGGDKAISDGSVQLTLGGDNPSVAMVLGSCVDVHGARLPGSPVTVQ
jgi:hypothetical protein